MPQKTIEQRFFEKIEKNSAGCWIWTGAKSPSGYGFFKGAKKNQRPHRWAYEYFVRPIPDGLVIDHLCRTPSCVNPEHLEAVTISENAIRGRGPKMLSEWYKNKTHCKNGHPRSVGKKVFPSGHAYCVECYRAQYTRTNAAKRLKAG